MTIDECDEHTGRLLKAIETAIREIRANCDCDTNEALITLEMSLAEYKSHLAALRTNPDVKLWQE